MGNIPIKNKTLSEIFGFLTIKSENILLKPLLLRQFRF